MICLISQIRHVEKCSAIFHRQKAPLTVTVKVILSFPFLSVSQAAFLLHVPKHDSTAISSHCYKLNSLQLRQLLELYEPDRDEQEIPIELIDNAVAVAENTADSLARGEGQEVRLEEEPDLHLPFLLPEDGYSSELIRGVPPGLREFLEPLIKPGKYLGYFFFVEIPLFTGYIYSFLVLF